MKLFSANYVLPISSEPIENGAVAIEDQRIVDVGTTEKLQAQFPDAKSVDFGEAVIMPGFVNCHSHLELTSMRGFLDEIDDNFASWLIKLTKTRAETLTDEDIETAAIWGALEGVKAGVTCFADIGRFGKAGFNALKLNGLRGILFQETEFSPDNSTADQDFANLKEKFRLLKKEETELVIVGISPHSPYTVSRALLQKITEFVVAENVRISIHTAESDEEQKLMLSGEGFFAELYAKEKVSWNAPKKSSVEYFAEIGVLDARPMLAHCVTVSESDIKLIAESGSSVAHCPKSNAKFGHGVAPFQKFLANVINTGLGSDSMASNNTCDILEEARFAALLARTRGNDGGFLEPEKMINAATFGGAKALRLENEIGTLESGKQADIIAIKLSEVAQMPVHDVYSTLLFATNSRDVIWTMVAGEEIYKNGECLRVDEGELRSNIRRIAEKMKG